MMSGGNAMERFKTKIIINYDTFRKLKKIPKPLGDKIRIAIVMIVCIIGAVYGVILGSILLIIWWFIVAISALLIIKVHYIQAAKTSLARIQESTGTSEIELITSFEDDVIKIYNASTEGTFRIAYDVITGREQTKDMYVLYTKLNQAIFINKTSLTKEQKDEFIRFIKSKCKNVKWKR